MPNITISNQVVASLPTVVLPSGTNKKEISIVITSNIMPKCAICLNMPNNPVSICNKKQLKITDRHLLCLDCAKKYTEKSCPICREVSTIATTDDNILENTNDEQFFIFDKQADNFIKTVLESSVFICPNTCGNIIQQKNLDTHLIECNNKLKFREQPPANDANNEQIKTFYFNNENTGKCFAMPITEYILNKNTQDSKTEYSYITYIEKFKLLHGYNNYLLKEFSACEITKGKSELNDYDLTVYPIQLKYNRGNLLAINFGNLDEKESFSNIQQYRYTLANEKLRANFYEDIKDSEYFKIKLKRVTYSIAIYPILTSDNPFVCFFEFQPSEISSLNSMYNNNRSSTPVAYKNLVEFFSPEGLSAKYMAIYGKNIEWQIRIAEREIE